MLDIKSLAEELSIPEEKLIKESLKTYLNDKLIEIESEIFKLRKKWKVKDIYEMNKLTEEGKIAEEEALDDFFLLDNLEAERDKILKVLKLIEDE